ncbi:hypothetical protein HPB50_025485 [Hyalomma asiaticum]|uniref:Uncharacterized protein n=1 Tax=Hyalomma asiaticum TaxID=266040 RepID=A0ACB7SHA2_HYAAI|nr:hypothetical protein HPB50_025485 [Hyalomma asiaticum]
MLKAAETAHVILFSKSYETQSRRPLRRSKRTRRYRPWTHLAGLLQKRHDLKEAWKNNKLNRHLRASIARLNKEIEAYAKRPCAQQWDDVCEEADVKMCSGSKEGLLKPLMADSDKPSRSGAQLLMERLAHRHTREHGRPAYVAAVTDAEGKLLTAASMRTRHTHEGEELAIALALQSSKAHSKIHTDSKTAARTFAAALVSKQTANLATKAIRKYVAKEAPPDEGNAKIHIAWFPAHMGSLAEEVHRLACELTNRAAAAASSGRVYSDLQSDKDPIITYHELASHYRESRRLFPAPHPKLSPA